MLLEPDAHQMPKKIGSGSLVPSQNSQEICSRTLVPSIIPKKIGFRSLMPSKNRKKNRLKEPDAKQKSPRKAARRPGANKIPKKSDSKGPGPIFLEIFARHKAHQLIFRGVAGHQAHEPIFLSTRLLKPVYLAICPKSRVMGGKARIS